jgi:hypothetical protein
MRPRPIAISAMRWFALPKRTEPPPERESPGPRNGELVSPLEPIARRPERWAAGVRLTELQAFGFPIPQAAVRRQLGDQFRQGSQSRSNSESENSVPL